VMNQLNMDHLTSPELLHSLQLTIQNPLALFGECVTCHLRRKTNPLFRTFTEAQIQKQILSFPGPTINITSYFSSSYFSEIMIMSSIRDKVINLNVINTRSEFMELIQNPMV